MVVADRPYQSPRVYARAWKASPWRGSPDELLTAARAALDEMAGQAGELSQQELAMGVVRAGGCIDFRDESKQPFDSLEAATELMKNAEPHEIENISINLQVKESRAWLVGYRRQGLTASARGTEMFASGIVATLKSRLTEGAEAGERAARVPLRLIDWLLLSLIPLSLGAMLFFYSRIEHYELVGFFLPELIVPILAASFAFRVIEDGRTKRMPARFALAGEGEQSLGKEKSDDGRREWLRHPLTTTIIGTVIGTLITAAVMTLIH